MFIPFNLPWSAIQNIYICCLDLQSTLSNLESISRFVWTLSHQQAYRQTCGNSRLFLSFFISIDPMIMQWKFSEFILNPNKIISVD